MIHLLVILSLILIDLVVLQFVLGTQQQAIGALSHIERIIKEKSHLFVKETPKRHRPP